MTFGWNEYKYHYKESCRPTALGWEVNACISLHDAFFFSYDSKDFLLVYFFCQQSPFLLPYSLSSKWYILLSLRLAFILASCSVCFYWSNIKLKLTCLSCQISSIISERFLCMNGCMKRTWEMSRISEDKECFPHLTNVFICSDILCHRERY